MSDLILGTPVTGTDESIGRLTALVCDPTTNEVTHLVVNADEVPGSERIVPIGRLAGCDVDHLTLAMTRHEFFRLRTFETVRFVPRGGADDIGWYLPFHMGEPHMTFAPHERIPKHELALRGATRVVDRDGRRLGRVHTFVVDPTTNDITHLTLQRGHLLGHRDVTVPVTDIDTITEEAIRLRTTADAVAARAGVPARPAAINAE